jgi:hypothetical protein
MRRVPVHLFVAAALAIGTLTTSGCSAGNPTEGYTKGVDQARSASALSSLRQALVTVNFVRAEAGGVAPADLAGELQARDPSNRYTTALPTEPGIVQVVGGGSDAVMLVAATATSNAAAPPKYVAAWQGESTILYYLGLQPPAYSSSAPSTAGWSSTPPQ